MTHVLKTGKIERDSKTFRADCTCGWTTFGCNKPEEAQDAFNKHLDYIKMRDADSKPPVA